MMRVINHSLHAALFRNGITKYFMSYRSKLVIQNLVESRREESMRIHTQYISAMELRNNNIKEKELIKTILSDLPEVEERTTHNFD
jgi:hypothetical protein